MPLAYILSFLIWPFGAVLFSFKHYNGTWTKNIIWAFCVFYGYTFVLPNTDLDADRIKARFEIFLRDDFTLARVLAYYYFENEEGVDFLQRVILYLVSTVTDNFQVVMAVFAVIFGFFYSRNIDYLLSKSSGKIKWINYLVIWSFIFAIPFWEINQFRFMASAQMFFYAVTPFVFDKSKKRLWLLGVIPFLHFSFLFPIIVVVIYLFTPKSPKLYLVVFLISFGLIALNASALIGVINSMLPGNYANKVIGYANKQVIVESDFSSLFRRFFLVGINLLAIATYFFYGGIRGGNKKITRYFSFSLLFLSLSNFISIIPSGDRFIRVAGLFIIASTFFLFQKNRISKQKELPVYLLEVFLLFGSFGFILIGIKTINVVAIVGNPLIQYFWQSEYYVRQFIPFL